MKQLEHFLLNENTNGLYKREAISSISLAKDVADKINELVDAYNELNNKSLAKDQEQDGRINKAVVYLKDNLVNSIHDLFELLTASGDLQNIIDNIYSSQVAKNTELLNHLNIFATPEMFGAVGDGKTDDTIAINRCLSSGLKSITFPDKKYKISESLVIPSDISVDFGNSEIIATNDIAMLTIQPNSYNINISNGFLNGNYACHGGVIIYENCKSINLYNLKLKNIKSKEKAYGIAIPSFSCSDIFVNNCTIDDISSLDNGVIADKNGWSKGIIVGFDGWLNEILPAKIDFNTYSKNITIRNCTIKNIKSEEDGDGIYIEGITDVNLNPMKYDLQVIIESNYFENIGKRFIKVLPAGGTTIRNNYGIITKDSWQTKRMHSFISIYAPNCVIENNEFHCRKNHVLYCIDLGVQNKYGEYTPGNIFITNNKIYNSADRENDNTASIYYGEYGGYFDEIFIQNNHFSASYYGVLVNNPAGTKTKTHINYNMFTAPINGFRCIQVSTELDILNIEKNYCDDKYTNAPISVDAGNYVNVCNNFLHTNIVNVIKCKYALIKNNFLINIATTRRFNVTASGWSVSENNHDSAGGSASW